MNWRFGHVAFSRVSQFLAWLYIIYKICRSAHVCCWRSIYIHTLSLSLHAISLVNIKGARGEGGSARMKNKQARKVDLLHGGRLTTSDGNGAPITKHAPPGPCPLFISISLVRTQPVSRYSLSPARFILMYTYTPRASSRDSAGSLTCLCLCVYTA